MMFFSPDGLSIITKSRITTFTGLACLMSIIILLCLFYLIYPVINGEQTVPFTSGLFDVFLVG
jgi:hypothetical protein